MIDHRMAKLNRDISAAKAPIEGYDAQIRDRGVGDAGRILATVSRAKERRNLAEYEAARDQLTAVESTP